MLLFLFVACSSGKIETTLRRGPYLIDARQNQVTVRWAADEKAAERRSEAEPKDKNSAADCLHCAAAERRSEAEPKDKNSAADCLHCAAAERRSEAEPKDKNSAAAQYNCLHCAAAELWVGKENEAMHAVPAVPLALPKSVTGLDHDEIQYSATAELTAGAHYCYAVKSGGKWASLPAPLSLAPPPGSTFSVLVFGDSGTASGEQRALFAEAENMHADLALHTGDIAYPDGSFADYERTVFAIYGALFRQTPFFPSPGNHDYRSDNGGPYRTMFASDKAPDYYSFDWGDVHFVALDSNVVDDTQTAWLAKDLAASSARFKVAYFHHPAYSSGPHGDSLPVQKAWVPLFDSTHVDLVLAGHDHDYERFQVLAAGKPNDKGTLYVTTGGGGAELYEKTHAHETSVAFASKHHFVRLAVSPCKIELGAFAIDGTRLDQTAIDKCK